MLEFGITLLIFYSSLGIYAEIVEKTASSMLTNICILHEFKNIYYS